MVPEESAGECEGWRMASAFAFGGRRFAALGAGFGLYTGDRPMVNIRIVFYFGVRVFEASNSTTNGCGGACGETEAETKKAAALERDIRTAHSSGESRRRVGVWSNERLVRVGENDRV